MKISRSVIRKSKKLVNKTRKRDQKTLKKFERFANPPFNLKFRNLLNNHNLTKYEDYIRRKTKQDIIELHLTPEQVQPRLMHNIIEKKNEIKSAELEKQNKNLEFKRKMREKFRKKIPEYVEEIKNDNRLTPKHKRILIGYINTGAIDSVSDLATWKNKFRTEKSLYDRVKKSDLDENLKVALNSRISNRKMLSLGELNEEISLYVKVKKSDLDENFEEALNSRISNRKILSHADLNKEIKLCDLMDKNSSVMEIKQLLDDDTPSIKYVHEIIGRRKIFSNDLKFKPAFKSKLKMNNLSEEQGEIIYSSACKKVLGKKLTRTQVIRLVDGCVEGLAREERKRVRKEKRDVHLRSHKTE